MAVESLWSAKELQSLGNAVLALEEALQEWEAENDFKIQDLMINIDTTERPTSRVGTVTLLDRGDTTLQFEAGDYEIGIA